MAARGMNMRDMKSRSMGKTNPNAPKPGKRPKPVSPKGDRPPDEMTVESDEMDEAVHAVQNDGHFAPTSRFVRDEEDREDCPDSPPPGWCGDD